MTNEVPCIAMTHCGWGPFVSIAFLPHLTLILCLYLFVHGLVRRHKTGSARSFGELLFIGTSAMLALFLTLGFWSLSSALLNAAVPSDIMTLRITGLVAEFLVTAAWMVPPVALGYIFSFVLRTQKKTKTDFANQPTERLR